MITLDDYESLIGAESVDRIYKKAEPLKDLHVANVNSTYYGGGDAELQGGDRYLLFADSSVRFGRWQGNLGDQSKGLALSCRTEKWRDPCRQETKSG
jgi:hypothetical protein